MRWFFNPLCCSASIWSWRCLENQIFHSLNRLKLNIHKNRIESSSKSHRTLDSKKTKSWRFRIGTYPKKTEAFLRSKDGNKYKFFEIIWRQKPSRRRYIFMGRPSHQITTTEVDRYWSTNDADVFHVPRMSKTEPLLKLFYCVFKFDNEELNHSVSDQKILQFQDFI